jgi:3-oxoacyl-[acyl-carrier-protein] synthase-3
VIRGIVAAVPRVVVTNTDAAFIKATGVLERRIAPPEQDVDVLGTIAAQRLLEKCPPDGTISALICVTQTPVARMPATACRIADRLKLKCAAFDVNLACSGYVYGLWLAHKIGGLVLLIAGDTVSRMASPDDKLFGDAVTATLVDSRSAEGMWPRFECGTDGSGFDSLIADPVIRMDGPAVMTFAIQQVPRLIERVTQNASVDWYLFHQANRMIVQHIAKKAGLAAEKVPLNIEKYGNTSSASIPLLMCDSEATPALLSKTNRLALFGFGAGWSWGGAMIDVSALTCLEVIKV